MGILDMDEREFELQAEILSVMANPKRLMIITMLGKGEKAVGEIATELGISLQNTSQHLRVMKDRGILVSRRVGQTVYYGLATISLCECCERVRKEMFHILNHRASIL